MYTAPNELSLVIFIPKSAAAATAQGMWSEASSSLLKSTGINLWNSVFLLVALELFNI